MDYRDVTVRLLGDVAGYVDKMGLAGDITADFVKTISGVEQKLDSLRISAGKTALAMGAGMQASLTGATFAAARWEQQFSSVRKTVDATAEDLGKLETNLRKMSTQMPVSAAELANLAAIAGQLGVSTDQIDEFAVVGAKLGVATELSSEQAIVSLSRLIKVMNASEGDIEGLGAALVQLGNVSNASEGPILDFAQNIAGTAGSFGIAADAVLGIATTFAEAGIESEAGGTAVQRVLIDMQTAAKTGGPQLAVFARTLGLTVKQFQDLVSNDPTEAFLKFNEALKAAGGDSIKILKDLNLDDARLIRAFTNVANSSGSMRDRIEESNAAFKDQSALNKEAETRFNTLLSSLTQFKNATAEVLRTFGDPFVEAVTKVVQAMTWMVNLFNNIPGPIKDMIAIFSGLSAGFLIAVGSALLLAKTVGTIITVFKLLKTTIPLTIIKGLAAGFTEVTVAGKQMGYMSRGLNSQSLAMQRLFEFSRQAALGLRGVTAGMTQFLGLQAASKIKGIGMSLAGAVAAPVGMLTGQRQAAKIVQDAAAMQKRINEEIGKQSGQIPTSGFERFTRRVKQGYYQMTASIGDAIRKIPNVGTTLGQQVGQTQQQANRIKSIFNDMSASFKQMMDRVRGGGGDAGFLDVGAMFGRKKKGQDRDEKEAADQSKASLGEQAEKFREVGAAAEDSSRKKKMDADSSSDVADGAEEAAGGMGLLEIGITAAVAAYTVWGAWQDRIAEKLGNTSTRAKQMADSLGQVYDATTRLNGLKVPDTDAAPEYKSAEFGKKFSQTLAAIATENGTDAKLDIVRSLIIDTQFNGQVTPEFMKAIEDILKRVFGEKKAAEYLIQVKAGLVDSEGRATTAERIRNQLKALEGAVPNDINTQDNSKSIGSTFNLIGNDLSNSLFGARGERQTEMQGVAQAVIRAMSSDEAGGAVGAQAIMKQYIEGIEKATGDQSSKVRLTRSFFGLIEDASKEAGEEIDFSFFTGNYEEAINDLRKSRPDMGFMSAKTAMDDLIKSSERLQITRRTAVAGVKEETGLYKILSEVQYDAVAGDNAAATSRFQRAVELSKQRVGMMQTIADLKEYRKNLPKGQEDGEEFRRVTSEIEKMANALRTIDLKNLDAELGNMAGPEAIRRLDTEINRLKNSVDGFDMEKLDALYGKRDEAVARAESELRSMVQQEQDLLKSRENLTRDHNERLAELAEQRNKSLDRERKNYRKRLDEIDKQEKEALKNQRENAVEAASNFADPFSRINSQRQEGAGAVAMNVTDQNRMFKDFQSNLDRLRKMGLSDKVIEAMGLNDPKNMQQAARFAADALANPAVIKQLEAAWKDRINLSEAFSKKGTDAAQKEIKASFKEMRDDAKESFDEASASINESYRETVEDATKNFKKASAEIEKQLAMIGKTTSDTLQAVIDKAMKSNNEQIRDFVKRFQDAVKEVKTAAAEIQRELFAGPWWVFLGFTSADAARKYGMTKADAQANGWTDAMAQPTRTNTNVAQLDRNTTQTGTRTTGGTGTTALPGTQFTGIPTPQPGPAPRPVVRPPAPAPVIAAPLPVIAPTPTDPRYRNVPEGNLRSFSSASTSTTTVTNTTAFTGAVTVVAQDPGEMARKLKQRARLARLTSPSGGVQP